MTIIIIETVEFNEDKCDNIVLIAEIITDRNETFCDSVSWDRTKYNAKENEVIENIAHRSATYHKIFEKYDEEISERELENFI